MVAADFTIADVLAWARTKPADESYPYYDTCGCALHQFLVARGLPVRLTGGGGYWVDTSGRSHQADVPFDVLANTPHTFGALAERIEALLPETPVQPSEWTRLDAYMLDIELASA
jgi:hypothetical protein